MWQLILIVKLVSSIWDKDIASKDIVLVIFLMLWNCGDSKGYVSHRHIYLSAWSPVYGIRKDWEVWSLWGRYMSLRVGFEVLYNHTRNIHSFIYWCQGIRIISFSYSSMTMVVCLFPAMIIIDYPLKVYTILQ